MTDSASRPGDANQPDLLGYCDRCDSIHRPSEPHKGAVADGGLAVDEANLTPAFIRSRVATAYRTDGEIDCDTCGSVVDLGANNVADAIARWNDHVADCGGESDE
jgi:hypothetical protein